MHTPGPHRSLSHDLVRFLVSGGITALFDVGTLVALTTAGAPLPAATTAAFFAALAVNFVITRLLLGRASTIGVHRQLGRYLVLLSTNYVITLVLVLGASALDLHYLLGKGAAIAATATVSFVAYRTWVFA